MKPRANNTIDGFNTTFVSVQEALLSLGFLPYQRFNTTFVSVQEATLKAIERGSPFQYNICVGSRFNFNNFLVGALLFQYNICVGSSS